MPWTHLSVETLQLKFHLPARLKVCVQWAAKANYDIFAVSNSDGEQGQTINRNMLDVCVVEFIYVCALLGVCICTCVCAYVCACVCACVYACV